MSELKLTTFAGQPALALHAPDGARATVLLHGAHLVSWVPAGGEEHLYLSPTAKYGNDSSVRGGVPKTPMGTSGGSVPFGFVGRGAGGSGVMHMVLSKLSTRRPKQTIKSCHARRVSAIGSAANVVSFAENVSRFGA